MQKYKAEKTIKILLLCMTICSCATQHSYNKYDLMEATGRLDLVYKDKVGTCTAVAYEKKENKYRFFTAAHCVAEYNKDTATTSIVNAKMLLSVERKGGKVDVYAPTVVAVGDFGKNEDFAIIEVEIVDYQPIIPLDAYPVQLDEDIIIVTSPLMIGNLFLRGNVSKEKVYIDLPGENMNWKDCIVVQVNGLGVANASSGSALIRRENGAIIGIVAASIFNSRAHISLLVIPISKFMKFAKEIQEQPQAFPVVKEVLECNLDSGVCE